MKTIIHSLFATLLLIYIPDCLAQEVLLRFFTTPAQRAMLDIREQNKNAGTGTTAGRSTTTLVPEVELNGIVKRSAKKDVVWVNDKNTLKSKQVDKGVRYIRTDSSGQKASLSINGRGTVKLKPGQVYKTDSGAIVEKYSVQQ